MLLWGCDIINERLAHRFGNILMALDGRHRSHADQGISLLTTARYHPENIKRDNVLMNHNCLLNEMEFDTELLLYNYHKNKLHNSQCCVSSAMPAQSGKLRIMRVFKGASSWSLVCRKSTG